MINVFMGTGVGGGNKTSMDLHGGAKDVRVRKKSSHMAKRKKRRSPDDTQPDEKLATTQMMNYHSSGQTLASTTMQVSSLNRLHQHI